jgi:type I pantothenate kinase
MEQRTEPGLSPYRSFSRAAWAALRADTPMTLAPDEVTRLRSLHDRLDMSEVEDIYLPLSRLLSLYVAAAQRLFRAQQGFLGTEDAKLPYIIGVAGSVAVGKSIWSPLTAFCTPTPSWRVKISWNAKGFRRAMISRLCCDS